MTLVRASTNSAQATRLSHPQIPLQACLKAIFFTTIVLFAKMTLVKEIDYCDGRVHSVLEIHLFVNPLGQNCRHSEIDIAKCNQMSAVKVRCTVVPLLNMTTIQQTMMLYHLPAHDLDVRAQVCQTLYQAILDYKAAQFQGQKRARQFLMYQQEVLANHHLHYNDHLAVSIAQSVPLDIEMFKEDRHSEMVKKGFRDDQKLASQMGITESETAIVVDTTNPSCGIKIDNFSFERLLRAYQKVHCARCALQNLANHCVPINQFIKHKQDQ